MNERDIQNFLDRVDRGEPVEMSEVREVAWTLTNGPVPKGMRVDNTCGEDRCVNPDHLVLVKGH